VLSNVFISVATGRHYQELCDSRRRISFVWIAAHWLLSVRIVHMMLTYLLTYFYCCYVMSWLGISLVVICLKTEFSIKYSTHHSRNTWIHYAVMHKDAKIVYLLLFVIIEHAVNRWNCLCQMHVYCRKHFFADRVINVWNSLPDEVVSTIIPLTSYHGSRLI